MRPTRRRVIGSLLVTALVTIVVGRDTLLQGSVSIALAMFLGIELATYLVWPTIEATWLRRWS